MKTLLIKSLFAVVAAGFSAATFAGLVNINEANSSALSHHIKGVGEKKAEAIVKYRTEHGAFKSIADLVSVKGIGEGILEKNLDNLSLNEGAVLVKVKSKVVVLKDKITKAKLAGRKPVAVEKAKLAIKEEVATKPESKE